MRDKARATGVLRLLFVAGALALAWLAGALLTPTAALAHAGHQHVSPVQSPSGEARPTAAGDMARPAPQASAVPAASFQPVDHPAGDAPSTWVAGEAATGSGSGAHTACICGWACGACASVACCLTALAPPNHAAVVDRRDIILGDLIADRLGGRNVVPLPRPPDYHPNA